MIPLALRPWLETQPITYRAWFRFHYAACSIVCVAIVHRWAGRQVPRAWLDRGWCLFTPWKGVR